MARDGRKRGRERKGDRFDKLVYRKAASYIHLPSKRHISHKRPSRRTIEDTFHIICNRTRVVTLTNALLQIPQNLFFREVRHSREQISLGSRMSSYSHSFIEVFIDASIAPTHGMIGGKGIVRDCGYLSYKGKAKERQGAMIMMCVSDLTHMN